MWNLKYDTDIENVLKDTDIENVLKDTEDRKSTRLNSSHT